MLVLQSLVFGSLICCVAFYAIFRYKRRRLYELADKIPGPNGLPLIGLGYKFLIPDYQKVFQILADVSKEYTSPARAWLGPELLILANTPEAMQIILNSPHCLDKSRLYDVLLLKKGLLTANGEVWRRHRKILNPAFTIRAVQALIPTFDVKSKVLVKSLNAKVDTKPFDISVYVAACSLESILKGTMELDLDVQSNPHGNRYIETVELGSRIMMHKIINVLYRFKPYYWFSDVYKFEQEHLYGHVLKIADKVLEEKEKRELQADISMNFDEELTEQPKNFINALTDPSKGLSHEEIWEEINTLIAAGHETSALVTSHALLMLALHPEVQRKVARELTSVLGTADEPLTYSSLSKLVYLDMIVKETMRLFPVLPLSARQSTDEFEIGEYTIPSGATILISAFELHRNPEFWGEDAHQFRPERFEPENFKKVHPYAYIPFTGGPRICIGWRYGMMFVKTILANVLRSFEVSSPLKYDELEYELTISMKIRQKCMIALTARN